MKNRNRKGFTLAELLIVVAIIAVLVAIAIPVFSASLEKSREATDLANIRSAYAEVTINAISGETGIAPIALSLKQEKAGWDTATAESTLSALTNNHVVGAPADGSNTATVEWLSDDECVKITFNGGSGGSGGGSGEGGGTGGLPAPHTTAGVPQRGSVVVSGSVACTFMSGAYAAQSLYSSNPDATAQDYLNACPGDAVQIDFSNVKTAETSKEDIHPGDIFYDGANYRYVSYVGYNIPDDGWMTLLQ